MPSSIDTFIKSQTLQAPQNISMALVGNKIDFAHRRAVSFKEAEDFARENEMLFMETSAKTGINVADIFLAVGRLYLKCLTSYIVLILPFFHY